MKRLALLVVFSAAFLAGCGDDHPVTRTRGAHEVLISCTLVETWTRCDRDWELRTCLDRVGRPVVGCSDTREECDIGTCVAECP